MKKYDFDIAVIGAGAAGISAAKTANGLGRKTAIVERYRLGGECTWSGCVPSKAIIHYAGAVPGKSGDPMEYVRGVIERIYSEERPEKFEDLGIKVIRGEAAFTDRHTIIVNGYKITAGKFIIATGSIPMVPPLKGIDRISFYTNETIFEIKKLPESIIILGGGPVGIELAQAFNRLGARVTVVEMASRILNREDPELVAILASRLIAEGVLLLTGAKAVMVEGDSGGVRVAFERNGDSIEKIEAQALLVAVGRIPSLKSLDPAGAGVAYTPRGITVNSYLRTNVPNIYACGDIVGPYYFSHVAGYQGIIAGINASLPFGRKQDLGQVLWTIYTDPECAHMGLTEDEARVKFKNRVRVYRVPYSRIDRARIESRDEGLAKYILDGRGMLLGAHIAGYMAGELIHEAQLARQAGIAFSRLQQIMHAYPSYSDIIRQAARDAYIDDIISNPFVILAGKLTGRGKRG